MADLLHAVDFTDCCYIINSTQYIDKNNLMYTTHNPHRDNKPS